MEQSGQGQEPLNSTYPDNHLDDGTLIGDPNLFSYTDVSHISLCIPIDSSSRSISIRVCWERCKSEGKGRGTADISSTGPS